MRSCVLGSRTWPELDRGLILAVPLGSTEQHGPHLPLDTDTRIAMALADRLAAKRDDVAVAPALPYGSSGEHAGFPGTLSIGQAALEQLLVELVRSADYFDGVVLVNAHGGNHEPLGCAAARLRSEDRGVLAWSPRLEGGDLHAGRTETSLLLALAPDVVHVDRAAAGPTPPMARLRAEGVAALSPTGVLGDPAGASAEEGRNLLEVMAADLVGAVAAWRP
jgi:mycofactocin precursor peptide peptidase